MFLCSLKVGKGMLSDDMYNVVFSILFCCHCGECQCVSITISIVSIVICNVFSVIWSMSI